MKEVTINRNSWHYKMMNVVLDDVPRNICEYIRWAVLLLIGALSGLAFIAFIMWLVSDFVAWIAWMLLNLSWIEPEVRAVFISFILILATIIFVIFQGQDGKFDSLLKFEGAQLIAAACESVHDKVCFKIIYK